MQEKLEKFFFTKETRNVILNRKLLDIKSKTKKIIQTDQALFPSCVLSFHSAVFPDAF